jgi:hypothetical protein
MCKFNRKIPYNNLLLLLPKAEIEMKEILHNTIPVGLKRNLTFVPLDVTTGISKLNSKHCTA